jgi:hypothetical protein
LRLPQGSVAEVMRTSRQPSHIHIVIAQKQQKNVEYFKYFGRMLTNYINVHEKFNSKLPRKKNFHQEEDSFHQPIGLKYEE